jgi:hypothetical protein
MYIVRFGQCSVFFIPINKRQPLHSGRQREFLSGPIFWLNQFIFKSAFFLHFLFYKVNLHDGIFKKKLIENRTLFSREHGVLRRL